LNAINPTADGMNCGKCAIALDSTLSGAPASALPGGPMTLNQVAQGVGENPVAWGSVRSNESISNEIMNAGAGARGIVFGGRGSLDNPGIGHFYNVVNQGGTVKFLGGQMGQVVDYSSIFSWYAMLRTR
jgi:filamentous hemagglutinin